MLKSLTYQSRLAVTIRKVDDLDEALAEWKLLEKYRASIFLSSTWMGPWLSVVINKTTIYLIRFYNSQNQLVGICFISAADIKRRKFFLIHQLSLNEAETNNNKFIIEYNGILHNPTYKDDIYYSLFDFFARSNIKFDELRINAISSVTIPDFKKICKELDLKLIEDESSKSYFTNLSSFSSNQDSYLASLSKNKREQIRRSIRFYSQFGSPEIKYASGTEERLDFFHKLGKLHQKYWNGRGRAGSFENERWIDFHTKMITKYPDNVQLIRVSYGDHILGYLYNITDRNIAYSIQSGFNYSENKNDRPGIISHFLVTNNYINNSLERYEYLAGESQYKDSLSNNYNLFSWYLVQKRTTKLRFENAMLWLKNTLTHK